MMYMSVHKIYRKKKFKYMILDSNSRELIDNSILKGVVEVSFCSISALNPFIILAVLPTSCRVCYIICCTANLFCVAFL